MPTTTDHAADYTRADNAIRTLRHALAGIAEAQFALADLSDSPDAAEIVALAADLRTSEVRIAVLMARETTRRDAAERAALAAATV